MTGLLRGLIAAAVFLGFCGQALAEDGAGRAAYERGQGLVPLIGTHPRPKMAARLSCAGCHGSDGRGGREGGATPPPSISWAVLSEATSQRPAYDAAALGRALRDGFDPAGRSLQMPRFELDEMTLVALHGYLQELDQGEHAGITATTINLRLPGDPASRLAAQSAIADFNAEGGSYGRLIKTTPPYFLDLGEELPKLATRLQEAGEVPSNSDLCGILLDQLRASGRNLSRSSVRRELERIGLRGGGGRR